MIKEMGAKRERVGEKWSRGGSTFFPYNIQLILPYQLGCSGYETMHACCTCDHIVFTPWLGITQSVSDSINL